MEYHFRIIKTQILTPCFHYITNPNPDSNSQVFNTSTNNPNSNNVLSDLKLSIVNFCSVTNKQTQLEVFLVTYAIDIIIGTESHLNESILNSEVFPNNYQTYRKDRNTSGGGVFISIKSSIPCTQINDNSTIEIV